MYLLVCNFLTRRPACPVSEPKPSDAKRVIMNITHLKGRWRITVEKGIDSIGLNVWGTRRERRFIAASYSKISHEVSRVCAAIKNVWILPADIAVPFVSCSLLFWSLVFFFFLEHAPLSFYVMQHEGTSLLGKGKVYMNISVSAWTLNAKVIYIWLHSFC